MNNKSEHKFAKVFDIFACQILKKFVNFRLCINKLPIETGRWQNIDHNLRKCNKCNDNDLGDELHYLYRCSFFDEECRNDAPFIKKKPSGEQFCLS